MAAPACRVRRPSPGRGAAGQDLHVVAPLRQHPAGAVAVLAAAVAAMVIVNHLRDVAQPDLLEVDEQADSIDGDEYRAAIPVAGRAMVRWLSAPPPSRRPALRLPLPACAGSAACWRSGALAARCPATPSCGRRHRRTRRGRSPDGKAVLLEIALDPAEELFPDAEAGPADEGLGRHPPRAVMRRDRAPVGVVPMPPEDRVDGPLEIVRLRLAARPAAFEQWHEYGPLRLGQHQIPLAHDSAANHITKGNLLLQSGYPPPVALCQLAATGKEARSFVFEHDPERINLFVASKIRYFGL